MRGVAHGALAVLVVACGRVVGDADDAGKADVVVGIDASVDAQTQEATVANEASAVLGCGVQPNAPWPMVAHDPARSGRSAFDGPRTKQIRWTLKYPDRDFDSSPAIAADGTIYLELAARRLDATERCSSKAHITTMTRTTPGLTTS